MAGRQTSEEAEHVPAQQEGAVLAAQGLHDPSKQQHMAKS